MRKFIPLIVMVGLFLWAAPALAATRTWDYGATSSSWNDATNWSDNTKPVDGDAAVFDNTDVHDCDIDADPAGVDVLNIAANYTGTVTNTTAISNVDSIYFDATGDAKLALAALDLKVRSFVVVNTDGDDVTYSAGGDLIFNTSGVFSLPDSGNAVPIQVTDAGATAILTTLGTISYGRSLTLGENDTLTAASADTILYLVPVGNDFLVAGTGADFLTTHVDVYLDAARTNGALTLGAGTIGVQPLTAAITGLQLTGEWDLGGLTIYSNSAWDTENPDSAFTIDFNDQDFTTNNFYLNNSTAATDTMVNKLLTGSGVITMTGVFHLNSDNHSIGIITMEGCSLKVAGTVTENDNSLSAVTGSGVLYLNGAGAQNVATPAVGQWPRVHCANTHSGGVTFVDAFTCSTFTVATASEDITFKEGVTSTVTTTVCAISGTRGTTDIESGSAGTAATLALPAGSTIRNCDVKDIASTGAYIDAVASVSNGGNHGAIRFRRD